MAYRSSLSTDSTPNSRGSYKRWLQEDIPVPRQTRLRHQTRLRRRKPECTLCTDVTSHDSMHEDLCAQSSDLLLPIDASSEECDTEGCFSHDILAEGCTADAERVPECADHISTGLMEEHGGYDAECVTGELRDEPYALIADQVIEFADDFSDGPLEELSDCDADREPLDEREEGIADIDAPMNDRNNININDFRTWNTPLYNGATTTLGQSVLLLMAFILGSKLTQSGCEDLLRLLSLLLPTESLLPTTKYLFKKYFAENTEMAKPCYYCPICFHNLTPELSCSICDLVHQKSALLQNNNYFLQLPLVPQLVNLLQTRGKGLLMRSSSNSPAGSVSDMYDGLKYKSLIKDIGSNANIITLTFNTDGVPLFKSSSFSIWPLQSFINELPAAERKSHMLLSGLWFGAVKPSVAGFFEPFVNELKALGTTGFTWINNGILIKSLVFAVVCSCDSVARAMLQNIKQFNGLCGCNWCTSSGVQIEKGRGFVRVYRDVKHLQLRTDVQLRESAKQAHDNNCLVQGVKGPSRLMELPKFDMVEGFIVDYMHCVDLGVMRQLASLWFDSPNHDKPWFIGNRIEDIDRELLQMQPPSNVTRSPRSLRTRAFWKASEWRSFLLFYSPVVLKDVLPPLFYQHLILLSIVLFKLQQESISQLELFYVSGYVEHFVSSFELLYGVEQMSYNIHILLHLVESVRNWGPLWCYSAYGFESSNGLFLKLFNGTQAVPKQVVSSFLTLQCVHEMAGDTFNCATKSVVDLFQTFMHGYGRLQKACYSEGSVLLIGSGVAKCVTTYEKFLIENLLHITMSHTVTSYCKVIFGGQVFHSSEYTRLRKRNNSVVLLNNNSSCMITDILKVTDLDNGDLSTVCMVKVLVLQKKSLCSKCPVTGADCSHVRIVSNVSDDVAVILPRDISRKYVVKKQNGSLHFISLLQNNLEKD